MSSSACWRRVASACLLTVVTSAFGSPENKPAIAPSETVVLFNGRDLSNFYTWLGTSDSNRPAHGRQDPDRVFSVVEQIDGAPAIRVSGEHWGGIITTERYTNYRLVVEFRWGNLTWANRKNLTRDSGILLHCQGEEGNYKPDFRAAWMRSIEFQIIEGGTGDMILVGGHERGRPERLGATLTSTVVPGPRHPLWSPDGKPLELGVGRPGGSRVLWRKKDPEVANVTGARGRWDLEKPVGEWNRLEALCDGANVAFFVNGEQVNGGSNSSYREGKILFQSEGAELYFRKIELHPVRK